MRPEIRNSWERSYHYGVSPTLQMNPYVCTKAELTSALEKSRYLVDISVPIIKSLTKYLSGLSAITVLADEKLCILKIIGDKPALDWAKRAHIHEGSLWSEKLVGTNAGGLMAALTKPVAVIGYEHFCLFAYCGSCFCAPIIDQGKIIGNVAILASVNRASSQTLGMVAAITKLIELKIIQERTTTLQKAVLESMPEGILVVDSSGIINFTNENCERMLQQPNRMLIGMNISDLFGKDPDSRYLINTITGRNTIKEEPLLLKVGKEKIRYNVTCTPLSNFASPQVGSVIILRENNRTIHLVSKKIGNLPKMTFNDIVGNNTTFIQAIHIAKAAANSSSNVLLLGESGTGKDVIAQSIHNASARRNKPFIAINCAALPRDLIASELFGYEEGAFTGARKGGQIGKFELADQGTIFLDEIGDIPLDLQASLLRVLEEKSVMRLGGTKFIPVNVRVIAATNKDLEEEISHNRFRRDLYYRLGVIKITIPPLRERPDDIMLLAQHFLETISQRLNKPIMALAPEVVNAFMNYNWPGNVRELQNVLEAAIQLTSGNTISYDYIQEYLRSNEESTPKQDEENLTISCIEKQMILKCLGKHNYNKSKTAKALGISRRTLYRRLKEYNIE